MKKGCAVGKSYEKGMKDMKDDKAGAKKGTVKSTKKMPKKGKK